MSNIYKQLCLSLVHAESEDEVVNLLQSEGYWDAEDHWQLLGGMENNFSMLSMKIIILLNRLLYSHNFSYSNLMS